MLNETFSVIFKHHAIVDIAYDFRQDFGKEIIEQSFKVLLVKF